MNEMRRRSVPLLLGIVVVAATTAVPALPSSAKAQTGTSVTEMEDREQAYLLREASLLENRGEYEEAERRLRHLLEQSPGVAAGVFGLERLLRRQGRLTEILPVIERYLEARPNGTAVRQFQLRLLAELDSLDALEAAAREWIDRDPDSVEPYRQVAGIYEQTFGADRALDVIQEAREATGRPDALALEAGSILARSGDHAGAGREWSRTIGEDGGNLSLVLRRIDDLPGDTREVVGALLENLEEEEGSPGRLRGAARLALAAGLNERAVELAAGVIEEVEGRTRKGFLVQFAQRAEERGAESAALWAYRRLRDSPESPAEGRALDERISKLALSAGDTALALEARSRIAASRPAGSVERRRALAARLELAVERLEPEVAARRLQEFRSEYPEAPELDALAARVAHRLVRNDHGEELPNELLNGVEGPRSALERAYLRLQAGEVEAGVEELEAALAGLAPARATEILELQTFLERAGPRGGELAGRVAALAHRGRVDEALEDLRSGLAGTSVEDRPGLLALGARVAERAGDDEGASAFRARLIREFPDAAETPEAAVRLARHRAGDPEGDREAVRILEDLIVSRPESAVVPEARRELEKLRSRVPGNGR